MESISLLANKLNFSYFTGADDDDTILKAFEAFEINGKIDAEMYV